MREKPEGQNLLSIARTTLLEKVVPLLPQDQRYSALMVANAIAIATRQWQAGDLWQQEELARLQSLLGADAIKTDEGLHSALLSANRALAQRIRSGAFDALSQPVTELLEWMAVQRVRESAPKALQPSHPSGKPA
jgi:hypothetical protein